MNSFTRTLLCAALIGVPAMGRADGPFPMGPTTVPAGLGVNIHFTDPRAGEMRMFAAAGFAATRMDYNWDAIETTRGKYDFSAYDRLMKALDEHHVRPIFILDYSNRLYDDGLSPRSDDGRAAFARWAAASARHFRGRGVIWEMYNEPNIGFWRPTPNTQDYVKLALAVGKAIRAAEPNATYVGPATSGIALPFIEECFRAGMLRYWNAVSVHPYRSQEPETVTGEYRRLRALITRYAPKGKHIPIISGEWGYSSGWTGVTPELQGKLLPRQWLSNLMNGVPVSIWYDWHDDGPDPKEPEHHFGTVLNPYHAGADPVYDPKPAYLAARALTTQLHGYRYSKRIAVGTATDYVFLFEAAGRVPKLAVWTTSATPRNVSIPVSPGSFRVVNHTGDGLPAVAAVDGSLSVRLTDAPQYLTPERANALLSIAAATEAVPMELNWPYRTGAQVKLRVRNPLTTPIAVRAANTRRWATVPPGRSATVAFGVHMERSNTAVPVRCAVEVRGHGTFVQETVAAVTDPLRITVLPRTGSTVPIRVTKLGGGAFAGLVQATGDVQGPAQKIRLPAGVSERTVTFATTSSSGSYRVGATVTDTAGHPLVRSAPAEYTIVDDFGRYAGQSTPSGLTVVPDGDPKVASTQVLAVAEPPDGPPTPGSACIRLTYAYSTGWKFVRVCLTNPDNPPIEGRPRELGIWVYGDGSGNQVRLRFEDSTGQAFQPDSDDITWKGWRYITFRMDGSAGGRWGGANDGVVHYPIRWNTLFLLDSPGGRQTSGTIYLSNPVLGR